MVAPITGPINSSWTGDANKQYWEKTAYRQKKPIDQPLPYRYVIVRLERQLVGDGLHNSQYPSSWINTSFPADRSGYSDVANASYEKLRGQISDSALWAVNLAEYHQSVAMMTQRLVQLTRFSRQIMKLDLVGAARTLGLDGKPAKAGIRRSLANNWLEYSFGWKPLIEDIHSTVELLQNPIKSIRPVGKASVFHYSETYSSGQLVKVCQGARRCVQGCEVSINNPNLFLANNLGLVNPAVVAWELIPFSFVVDWFVNVGSFLSQGTDFLGLTVKAPWSTVSFKGTGLGSTTNIYWSSPYNRYTFSIGYIDRKTYLTGVTLKPYPARIWGWQRAANAASVLTQVLSRF